MELGQKRFSGKKLTFKKDDITPVKKYPKESL